LIPFFICTSCLKKNNCYSLNNKAEVAEALNRVADWQIDNFSYETSGNLHDYGIGAWGNSVFYLGLTHWASLSGKGEQYYNWLYNEVGKESSWQIPANFISYPRYGIYHADELCIAQFYFEMYKKYREPLMIESTKKRLKDIVSGSPDRDMSHRNKQTWTWCDALFMAPPAYLSMGLLENDTSYINFMDRSYRATYNHLFDREESLFYRDDSYLGKREVNGEKIFWGRGNGWVIAGIANLLKNMPGDYPERQFYTGLFKAMASRLVELQHEEGYWHASLLDPESYPSPETSATSLIAYALAYGINSGILDEQQYLEPLECAWNSLLASVEEDGKLCWVQPIGADPKKVTREMTSDYGVGAFLMAGSEIFKMKNF